jgi:hypothetical protein
MASGPICSVSLAQRCPSCHRSDLPSTSCTRCSELTTLVEQLMKLVIDQRYILPDSVAQSAIKLGINIPMPTATSTATTSLIEHKGIKGEVKGSAVSGVMSMPSIGFGTFRVFDYHLYLLVILS